MRNIAFASLAALAVTACATAPVVAQAPTATGQAAENANDQLKAFPAATAGQKRHVLTVPAVQNEDELKVELIIGKTQQIDCNNHVLGGEVQTRTAEGWGYDYYVVPRLGPGASTLMGCPNNSTREAFVTIPQQTLVRYNSRLPIVIYTPEDAEVRYRIWRAGEVRGLN
ncbi:MULTISPECIES: serine protease inhibitor ecotin [unclassified Brevundimonas]|uniref:serine protease inhibitor ecotin n=1 Tax=unclassified Brevundimonas TaxID=2622653 RepID=UPI0025C0ABC0|nr:MULTISPECIES: serine protease inhibitor ecotin [unclassified Brevundimonas]